MPQGAGAGGEAGTSRPVAAALAPDWEARGREVGGDFLGGGIRLGVRRAGSDAAGARREERGLLPGNAQRDGAFRTDPAGESLRIAQRGGGAGCLPRAPGGDRPAHLRLLPRGRFAPRHRGRAGLGRESLGDQRRGADRPEPAGPAEGGREADRGGPAPDGVGGPGGPLAADPAWGGRGLGAGVSPCGHRGEVVRPRIRGGMVSRLQGAGGSRPGRFAGGVGGGYRGRSRSGAGGGAVLRGDPAGGAGLGKRGGADAPRLRRGSGPGFADGDLRKPGRAGRQRGDAGPANPGAGTVCSGE